MRREFHKTVITITIITEGPPEALKLKELVSVFDEPQAEGTTAFIRIDSIRTCGKTVARLMRTNGKDPAAIHLDDEGEDLDD
jgi:hypothetical protein